MFLAAGAGFFPMAENKSVGEEVAVDGSEKKKSLFWPLRTHVFSSTKKKKKMGPFFYLRWGYFPSRFVAQNLLGLESHQGPPLLQCPFTRIPMVAAVLTFKKHSLLKRALVNKCVNWLFLRTMFPTYRAHLFQMIVTSGNSLLSVTPCSPPPRPISLNHIEMYLSFSISILQVHFFLRFVYRVSDGWQRRKITNHGSKTSVPGITEGQIPSITKPLLV